VVNNTYGDVFLTLSPYFKLVSALGSVFNECLRISVVMYSSFAIRLHVVGQ